VFAGGYTTVNVDTIDYITISTAPTHNATDFGNLSELRRAPSATSNGTNNRGVFGGGLAGSNSNVIDYITISSAPSNATDFGDLTLARYALAAASNA